MIVHKKHSTARKTMCGISYDSMIKSDIDSFFVRVRCHKHLITCKRCLKAMKEVSGR